LKKQVLDLEKNKKINETKELKDFIKDLTIKGYGLVRIDPDDVFYRGRR
jgi:hypothetical protein